jgi:hypothetical protein
MAYVVQERETTDRMEKYASERKTQADAEVKEGEGNGKRRRMLEM